MNRHSTIDTLLNRVDTSSSSKQLKKLPADFSDVSKLMHLIGIMPNVGFQSKSEAYMKAGSDSWASYRVNIGG